MPRRPIRGAEEELVAKVGGKGFAFIGPGTVSVKCGRDAAEAAEWRDRYPEAITTSHYVGRYGWNTVDLAGAVPAVGLRLREAVAEGGAQRAGEDVGDPEGQDRVGPEDQVADRDRTDEQGERAAPVGQ